MSRALGREVARALLMSATAAGVPIVATVTAERAWASALFEGVRFTLDLASENPGFGGWLDALPEADLPLRAYFVASAEATDRREGMATIELLAIAES